MIEPVDTAALGWLYQHFGVFFAWIWQLLCAHWSDIWSGIVGFLGSCVRVALGLSAGEPMPRSMVFATLTTGTVLCVTTSKALTATLHLPAEYTTGVGFVVGIMGMKFVQWVMAQDFNSIMKRLVMVFTGGKVS